MSILGIPFGAEELLASEWREKMSNKRKLGFDGEYQIVLNTLTIDAGSQFSGYGFEIFFETNQTIEIETPVIEDGIAYVYTTADQVTKTFSDLQISMTEPTNENQQGLFDIVLAKIKLHTGVEILKKEDVRFSNGYYELTDGDMIRTPSVNIDCLRLPTGIYDGSGIINGPISGNDALQSTIQVFENENVRNMIYIDGIGTIYTSTSTDTPVEWKRIIGEEFGDERYKRIDKELIISGLNLNFEETVAISEFSDNHPYDMGYRTIYIKFNSSIVLTKEIVSNTQSIFSLSDEFAVNVSAFVTLQLARLQYSDSGLFYYSGYEVKLTESGITLGEPRQIIEIGFL